jgi:hypothetical protein
MKFQASLYSSKLYFSNLRTSHLTKLAGVSKHSFSKNKALELCNSDGKQNKNQSAVDLVNSDERPELREEPSWNCFNNNEKHAISQDQGAGSSKRKRKTKGAKVPSEASSDDK